MFQILYILTNFSVIFTLEKQIVLEVVKKFPAFNGTPRFIAVLIVSHHHLFLS
jgi:hypothetical protein